ncbi:hypothetical protein TvY486_0010730 [Trypanosoma vivax Y486]|uniref:Uncharacterized protein n=1 Tax=Trypanosoma vivax (strain Y486) TaxID=1055687 RepID=F9WLJ7_TRYVY|nr:hypothetical protein TvY486_0010730 [Trypanosoma vivax Y486]|eukprot:CCD18389.1 hypothetical protein TvY486_0010730 [Trypanosoma vivax Y486]
MKPRINDENNLPYHPRTSIHRVLLADVQFLSQPPITDFRVASQVFFLGTCLYVHPHRIVVRNNKGKEKSYLFTSHLCVINQHISMSACALLYVATLCCGAVHLHTQ